MSQQQNLVLVQKLLFPKVCFSLLFLKYNEIPLLQVQLVMVSPMIEIAVHMKYLVSWIKVIVIGTINAMETLSVVGTIVLEVSH